MTTKLHWPQDQLFVSPAEREAFQLRCNESFRQACERLRIPHDLTPYLGSLYIPLAAWLERRRSRQPRTLVIGLCGGQGSGKSTVATLLKTVLVSAFNVRTVCFSIDDIYKTKADRQQLAKTIHPLFATRGVPFTHDVHLGIDTIKRLVSQSEDQTTAIPSFDKATDTRAPEDTWPRHTGATDIIIMEGWCVGALPQTETALSQPINALERDEDPDGVWRRRVNDALQSEYRTLFGYLDALLMLKVQDMEQVFTWRRLQEHKLAEQAAASGVNLDDLSIMNDAEVDRFIMHYERITRHILDEMPRRADIVFSLDDSHNAARVTINKPI